MASQPSKAKKMRLISSLWLCLLALTAQAGDYTSLTPTAASPIFQHSPGIFLDVRSKEEWEAGHLDGAKHIPLDQLEAAITAVFPDKNQAIISFCRSGRRAQRAAELLLSLGYQQVSAVTTGGYAELLRAKRASAETSASTD